MLSPLPCTHTFAIEATSGQTAKHIRDTLSSRFNHLSFDEVSESGLLRIAGYQGLRTLQNDPLPETTSVLSHEILTAFASLRSQIIDLDKRALASGGRVDLLTELRGLDSALNQHLIASPDASEMINFIQNLHRYVALVNSATMMVSSSDEKSNLQATLLHTMKQITLWSFWAPAEADPVLINPTGLTKRHVKTLADAMASEISNQLGMNVKSGKRLDLWSELQGYPSGFQQYKPLLLPDVISLEHITPNLKKHLSIYKYTDFQVLHESVKKDYTKVLSENMPAFIDVGNQNADSIPISTVTAVMHAATEMMDDYYSDFLRFEPNQERSGLYYFFTQRPHFRFKECLRLCEDIIVSSGRILQHATTKRAPSIPSRPEGNNPHYVSLAANKLQSDIQLSDKERQDVISAYDHPMDGFDLAMELKNDYYWDIDRDLADNLDSLDSEVGRLLLQGEWIWAEAYPQALPFPIGARIERGIIDGVDKYSPFTYLVRMDDETENSTRRLLIKFECAET
jgi:hypothetical protein